MMTQNVYIDCRYSNKSAVKAKIPVKIDFAFWIFLLGSVVGFIVETAWCFFVNGSIESRSSMLLGPFTLIYGLGALVLYIGTRLMHKNSIPCIFIFGAVASTVVEYVCSFLQETLFGSVSWDYSGHAFNIGGRVSLLYSFFWGLLSIFWFMAIQPVLEKIISKIPARIWKPLTWGLAIFLVLDVAVSIAAVTRWGMRLDGIQPFGVLATMLDKLFPNEFMMKIYPNMLW